MRCTECNSLVKPIVALDLDGTLGNYHEHLLTFMASYFGRSFPAGWTGDPVEWQEYLGLTTEQYREAKLAFRQGGLKRWMPMFLDADTIPRVASSLGAEIWITTTRPWMRLDSVDPDTREWLRRNGIVYDHLLYDDHKYLKLAELVGSDRVVFVLDDLVEMYDEAESVMQEGTTFLIRRQHNLAVRENRRSLLKFSEVRKVMEQNIKWWRTNNG